MSFEKAYRVSDNLELAKSADVAAAAKKLGVTFPAGYQDYVTKLGHGIFAGYVRVYMPGELPEMNKEWRERVTEYYFWDDGADVLAKDRVLESIVFADTVEGDELIFHPKDPAKIYVLPRNSEEIFVAGKDLDEAIEWLCSSGELTAPISFRYFESNKNRQQIRCTSEKDIDFAKLKAAILGVKAHDHAEESEEDAFVHIWVKDFFGDVAGFGAPNNIIAIMFDKDRRTPTLEKYLDVARKLKFEIGEVEEAQ